MRFGVCCSLEEAGSFLDAGFDYVELAAGPLAENPNLYRGLPVEATNLFFPSSERLFGPNPTSYMDHVRKAVPAAARLGVSVMVIGSGASRRAPDGWSPDLADEIFADIAFEISRVAAPLRVVIAPESLNRSETNVGNDLARLSKLLAERGVAYTADVYHVLREWRAVRGNKTIPPSHWARQLRRRPAHVHLADLPRNVPATDDPDVLAFLERLVSLRYDARISFEGSREGFTPKEILKRMRELWASAND